MLINKLLVSEYDRQVPETPKLFLKTELKIEVFPASSSTKTDPSIWFLFATEWSKKKLFRIWTSDESDEESLIKTDNPFLKATFWENLFESKTKFSSIS